jgi:hypothetical protein
MSMHLMHAGITTLNTKKSRKKSGVKQNRALADHDRWLRSQGVHPEQLAQRSKSQPVNRHTSIDTISEKKISSLGNGFAPIVTKRSVFDSAWRRDYEDDPVMAEREAIALQEAEEKKKYIRPLYNKGPVQYSANTNDLKEGNGRGRR